jgi:RNA polymerase sigma-70 factor (ECF subfamily)
MPRVTSGLPGKQTALDNNQLEGLRSLEPQALGRVHTRYFPELYRYALYRLGEEQLAEDLASETFARLISALSRGTGPERNLRGWLFSTISNLLHDHLRAKYRLPKISLEHAAQDTAQDDPVHQIDATRELRQALKELTPDQQQVIGLRFGGAFSLAETAELMGKNLNAVKALQFRALGALRRLLEEND